MTEEEKIKQELENKFNYLKDAVVIKRERRMFTDAPSDHFLEVFDYAVKQMGFSFLSAITGMDELNAFSIIYHLSKENGIMLNIKIHTVRENPLIKTITQYFPSAENYERELEDLLGIKIEDLKPGRRYPLPDDWPTDQHPLRKDWKPAVKEG